MLSIKVLFFALVLGFAAGQETQTVLGVANLTGSTPADARLVLLPPDNVDGLGPVVFYEIVIRNIVDMTSAQILSGKGGEIVVEILPTDTEIDNADYAGIIRYGSDDESAFSTTEVVDGVTVYKDPVTINAGGAKASASFNADDLMGPLEGKTIADFEKALAAGELYAVVKTTANPDGEIGATIETKAAPAPIAEIIENSSVARFSFAAVVGGIIALFA